MPKRRRPRFSSKKGKGKKKSKQTLMRATSSKDSDPLSAIKDREDYTSSLSSKSSDEDLSSEDETTKAFDKYLGLLGSKQKSHPKSTVDRDRTSNDSSDTAQSDSSDDEEDIENKKYKQRDSNRGDNLSDSSDEKRNKKRDDSSPKKFQNTSKCDLTEVKARETRFFNYDIAQIPATAKKLQNVDLQWFPKRAHFTKLGNVQYASSFNIPSMDEQDSFIFPQPLHDMDDLVSEEKLVSHWNSEGFMETLIQDNSFLEYNEARELKTKKWIPICGEFSALIKDYRDTFAIKPWSVKEIVALRIVYTFHLLNHIISTKRMTVRNDKHLNGKEEENGSKEEKKISAKDNFEKGNDRGQENEFSNDLRDQGFTRPRVLILLPLKNMAYDIINLILSSLLYSVAPETRKHVVENYEKFLDDYGPTEEEEKEEEEGGNQKPIKPKDHQYTFRGNTDDDFRIGLSISLKKLRLYSNFFFSDVIIASPLGLRRIFESEKNEDGSKEDFLSSIEICVIDGMDVMAMQNLDHLSLVFEKLNRTPRQVRKETDFSRVREYFLEGLAKMFRQTILISRYSHARFLSIYRMNCHNHSGRYLSIYPTKSGSVSQIVTQFPQHFHRISGVEIPGDAPQRRFETFKEHMFPLLRSMVQKGILIFVPHYFDYVRLRNFMVEQENNEENPVKFASLCEYTSASDIQRSRVNFFHGRVQFLLLTERYHYYWRHKIRGAHTIFFYGLPENAHFYPEVVNFLIDEKLKERDHASKAQKVICIYDKFDRLTLTRIVGENRAKYMIAKNSKPVYMFR